MEIEKFFFPLSIIASIVGIYVVLRPGGFSGPVLPPQPATGADAAYPVQTSMAPATQAQAAAAAGFGPASPGGIGTATTQPLQAPPWYLSYNVSPLPPPLPLNGLGGGNLAGCGTCSQGWV